jgi:hypothetical protein
MKRLPKSGYPGVTYHKTGGRWIARACKGGKEIYLGCFLHKEDACRAREHFLETGTIMRKNNAS